MAYCWTIVRGASGVAVTSNSVGSGAAIVHPAQATAKTTMSREAIQRGGTVALHDRGTLLAANGNVTMVTVAVPGTAGTPAQHNLP